MEMENNRIPWESLVDGLIANNKSAFFQTLYSAISNHPSYVILSDMEYNKKAKIIDQMISFYENREDYEKCSVLLGIKKEIQTC
jgi:hypothetical protein